MNLDDIIKNINFSALKKDLKSAILSLINIIEKLSSRLKEQKAEIQQLRDEVNRLKGEQGKPDIKPNTTNDISSEKERKKNKRAKKKTKKQPKSELIKIDRTETCHVDKNMLPKDAEFKDYRISIIQDIQIKTDNIEFKREVYYSPSENKSYIAPLPNGYEGGFGPTLKSWTITFKNAYNISESKIRSFLTNAGIYISKGTITNILIKKHQQFHQEKSNIVEAGLQTTTYQAIDDTKARVNGQNYHTHILGNPYFTAFFTKPQKNRSTVLEVLSNDKEITYCLNDLALCILKQLTVTKKYFKELESFKSEKNYQKIEFELLILQLFPSIGKQVKTKIFEAAAIAAYRKGVDRPVVNILLCDNAPQFKLICENLALCWVHDGRHYKRLSPVFKYNAKKINAFLKKYWKFYHKLLRYKASPSDEKAQQLSDNFDQLFSTVTGYNDLDDRIAKTKSYKMELLLALKYPELPLHNNDMELGARVCARKRDVSLHTMTDEGTKANDTFLTIIETCKKLGVNPFKYILDRINKSYQLPALDQLILQKYADLAGNYF